MHILLTDALTCPRCGPEFGLIVLADRMHGRQVMDGVLGCANCRNQYPVAGAVADLRVSSPAAASPPLEEGDEDRALRLAALSGVSQGQGIVLVAGASPDLVERIGGLLPNAQVVGASSMPPEAPVPEGTGWLLLEAPLPFRNGSLRGVLVPTGADDALLEDAPRVLARGAHLVVEGVPTGFSRRLADLGLQVLLEQDGVAVASNSGPR